MTTFATITSRGQITLPAEVRCALGLRPGQRVSVRVEGDHLVVDVPQDVATIRQRIREEAEARGTWGKVPQADDGWTACT